MSVPSILIRRRSRIRNAHCVDCFAERGFIRPLHDPVPNHRDRNRAEAAGDQLVVGAIVLIDVVRRERHTFA